MKSFQTAVEHIFNVEGGFCSHQNDAGGPTNFGVTLATLSRHRGETCTADDVRALTKDEATAIYLMLYWRATNLDLLENEAVATIVFDQVVNRGPRVAVRALQAVLQSTFAPDLAVDGILGPKTANAANCAPQTKLALKLVAEAQRGYLGLWRHQPSQGVFLQGWIARTWKLLDLL